MNLHNYLESSPVTVEHFPFSHFWSPTIFKKEAAFLIFDWFEKYAKWDLVETEFYEQYEFSLLNIQLPLNLKFLISDEIISRILLMFQNAFKISNFELVGVMAHKLVNGQRIGIHNDFINGEETHRLVIHLNPGWNEEKGGYLMLFNSSKADDISKVISPLNNFGFGFEISNNSHHAVSKIYNFSRYTIVYTFKKT